MQFNVTGGMTYVDGAMSDTITKLLPRFAGAYLIDQKTVFRGGIGLFSFDYFFDNMNQAGLLAGDAGHRLERRRSDVHGRDAEQSAPRGAVDSAGRFLARVVEPARAKSRERCSRRNAKRRITRGGKRAFNAISDRAGWCQGPTSDRAAATFP